MKNTLALLAIIMSFGISTAKELSSKDITGKWYVISSNSIPFRDGSVEFTSDGKMIISWEPSKYLNQKSSIITNSFKFTAPDTIEYSNSDSPQTYHLIINKSKAWLVLKSDDGSIKQFLDRKPRT